MDLIEKVSTIPPPIGIQFNTGDWFTDIPIKVLAQLKSLEGK